MVWGGRWGARGDRWWAEVGGGDEVWGGVLVWGELERGEVAEAVGVLEDREPRCLQTRGYKV